MKHKNLIYIIGTMTFLAGVSLMSAGVMTDSERSETAEHKPFFAAATDSVPAAPTMTVTPDAKGANSVRIVITPPTKDKKGKPVTTVTKLKLYRANAVIKEFVLTESKAVTYYDTVPKTNMSYSYGASAVNRYGEGAKVTRSGYVGIQKPAAIADVNVEVLKGNRNKVRISWDAPTLDTQKRPIDPSKLTYTIKIKDASAAAQVLESDYAKTSYEYEYTGDKTQLVNFIVAAKNEVGISGDKYSGKKVFLGAPYALPYKESYGNGVVNTYQINMIGSTGPASFSTFKDEMQEFVCASDNDNGHLAILLTNYGSSAQVVTNYIDLKSAKKPYIFIDLYKYSDERTHTYEILAIRDSVETSLLKGDFTKLPLEGWNPVGVDLSSLVGQTPQIAIRVACGRYGTVHIDNIRIMEAPEYDMMVGDIKVPAYINEGMPTSITAQISNQGIGKSKETEVSLLRNGEAVQTIKHPAMNGLSSNFINLTDTLSSGLGLKECSYSLKVTCPGDNNSANDTTESKKTAIVVSSLPKISNLTGQTEDKGRISLDWKAPDVSQIPLEAKIEDFESYEPLKDVAGEWTTLDCDQKDISGFSINNIKLPVTGKHGFFIMDVDKYPGSFESQFLVCYDKGKRYAVSMYINESNVLADDWLISPELNGCEQMISYMCASYFNFPLVWEAYYSKTGKDPKDFIRLDSMSYNSKWKKFMHLVPEGAKYFAIHSCHNGPTNGMASCMPMIDDIKFIPAGKGEGKLLGYNVYCDNRLITPQPVKDCRYEGPKPDAGKHTYKVTAVYDRGESSPLEMELTVGVENVIVNSEIVGNIWYDMTGIRVAKPEKGDGKIYIVKTKYANGKTKTEKIINR